MKYLEGESYYEYLREQKLKKINPDRFVSSASIAKNESELEDLDHDDHLDDHEH
jgi:hypothetical protein